MTTQLPQQPEYPVQFSVDYPHRDLNRVTTAFRIFTIIPIAIVLGAVSACSRQYSFLNRALAVVAAAGGVPFMAPLPMSPFREKAPRLCFDRNLEVQRSGNRVGIYLTLLDVK